MTELYGSMWKRLRKIVKGDDVLSHDTALSRIAGRGLPIATLIDVGAAEGAWTRRFLRHWPKARCHLIEAKEYWRPALAEMSSRNAKKFTYAIKGAAAAPGEALFTHGKNRYGGAVVPEGRPPEGATPIPVTSIDAEVQSLRLRGPFCIKLDTHGTEVDILAGAHNTLAETALLCIETYNFIGQKRFPEMILHLQDLGFRVADIAEPLFRPLDSALWQIDFYFQRADDAIFNINAYDAAAN